MAWPTSKAGMQNMQNNAIEKIHESHGAKIK